MYLNEEESSYFPIVLHTGVRWMPCRAVPSQIMPRRAGDVEAMYADPSLAKTMLGWTAKRNLKDMCNDTWRWQSTNPNGYKESSSLE